MLRAVLDDALDIGSDREIALDREYLATAVADGFGQVFGDLNCNAARRGISARQCKCRPDAGRSAGDQHRLAGEVAKVGVTRVGVTGAAEVTGVEVTGAVVVAGIPPGSSCSS